MGWMICAALCAYFIKGLCGFANTLVFTTILSFGYDNVNISPVELILGYSTNLMLIRKERASLKTKIWLPLTAIVLVGDIPGILLLKNVDVRAVKIAFGFIIIALALEMFFRENGGKMGRQMGRQSGLALGAIGIISGVLCGLYGVGALLAAYMSRVTDSSQEFKANICMVFCIENIFRIILYTILGIITLGTVRQAVVLVPVMLVGMFAGMKSGSFLNEKTVKKLVIVMLHLSGAALVITNFS